MRTCGSRVAQKSSVLTAQFVTRVRSGKALRSRGLLLRAGGDGRQPQRTPTQQSMLQLWDYGSRLMS